MDGLLSTFSLETAGGVFAPFWRTLAEKLCSLQSGEVRWEKKRDSVKSMKCNRKTERQCEHCEYLWQLTSHSSSTPRCCWRRRTCTSQSRLPVKQQSTFRMDMPPSRDLILFTHFITTIHKETLQLLLPYIPLMGLSFVKDRKAE